MSAQSVPARRQQRITVAIPASLTLDIPHLREKTGRIGYLGRSLAIFRVEHVLIYLDQDTTPARKEARLIEKVLRFQETPPYLRKQLFPVDPDLAYTGTLPPLRTPHHPDRKPPQTGMIRDAIITTTGPVPQANAGFQQPVNIQTSLKPNTRLTIQLKTIQPLTGEIISPTRLSIYWGLQITREEQTIGHVLKRSGHDLTISTSREGTDIRQVTDSLRKRWMASKHPIILFGSPSEGIPQILSRSKETLPPDAFNLNTIPNQGTETVRTEEAVLGTLAVLNVIMEA